MTLFPSSYRSPSSHHDLVDDPRSTISSVLSLRTVARRPAGTEFRIRGRLLLLASTLLLLTLIACARIGTPQGWSAGTVAEDVLYIGTMEGELIALNRSDGEIIWEFPLREGDEARAIYGSPAVTEDAVYVGGYDGILYSVSRADGTLKWQQPVGERAPIVGGAAAVDGVSLVGSSDGHMYAFDTSDGSERWAYPTGGSVWSAPTVAGGLVYFGSMDRNVYALRLDNGSEEWKFPTNGAITAEPLVINGTVYVGAFDGVFYAIDARTGQEVWRFEGAKKWYWSKAIATEDAIFVSSLDGNLYSLDISTGELKWTLETEAPITGSPVIVSDRIAVASDDGALRVATLGNGSEEGLPCEIGEKVRAGLVEADGVVYLSVTDHTIRAYQIDPRVGAVENWVHHTDKEDPFDVQRRPDC